MGARSGAQYLERLAAARPSVHIHGETLHGAVAEHPAFAGLVATYASLYDMQHDAATRETMTFEVAGERARDVVPGPAQRGGPRAPPRDDGESGRASASGRSGAPATTSTARSWRSAAAGRGSRRPTRRSRATSSAYYERVRDEDLLLTHTLITPQANRSQNAAQQEGGELTARIVREDDNGVVIRGARMLATIGPIADEMLVFPSTVLKGEPEDAPYCVRVRAPLRRARPALRLPRVLRRRARPLRPPARRRASRRSTRSSIFDDVHVPVRALLPARAPGDVQRDLHRHDGGRAHDPPGRDAHGAQDRGDARPRLAARRDDRDRPVPARAGGHRRGDRRARDRAGADRAPPRTTPRSTSSA